VQRAAVGEAAGGGRPPRFQPHLSVGQVQGNVEMLRLVAELQAAWQPVRFSVTGISLIWRANRPMTCSGGGDGAAQHSGDEVGASARDDRLGCRWSATSCRHGYSRTTTCAISRNAAPTWSPVP